MIVVSLLFVVFPRCLSLSSFLVSFRLSEFANGGNLSRRSHHKPLPDIVFCAKKALHENLEFLVYFLSSTRGIYIYIYILIAVVRLRWHKLSQVLSSYRAFHDPLAFSRTLPHSNELQNIDYYPCNTTTENKMHKGPFADKRFVSFADGREENPQDKYLLP